MCFHISDKHPEAIVAKKDMRVYKLLENLKITRRDNLIGYSPYRNYLWWGGKLITMKEPLVVQSNPYYPKIEAGLHAYTDIHKAKREREWNGEAICEFFIPKGATYYINKEKQEVVADKMIWSGRVWKSDRWGEFKIKK